MPSLRDIFSGKVKWVRRIGWCDQPFIGIKVYPIEQPTEAQIRYVQTISTYRDQNFLQIRRLLQQGSWGVTGLHLPADVELLGAHLRELGISYSLEKSHIYRSL